MGTPDPSPGPARAGVALPREARSVHPRRLVIAAFFGDADAAWQSGQRSCWPPPSARQLYHWGWDGTLGALGKEAALRACLAVRLHAPLDHLPADAYERRARPAAAAWAVAPDETRRKDAGRLASMQCTWSFDKVLAHAAGARHRWSGSTGLLLTGNPAFLQESEFVAICARISRDVIPWALGERDPVAAWLVDEGESWAAGALVPDASREPR